MFLSDGQVLNVALFYSKALNGDSDMGKIYIKYIKNVKIYKNLGKNGKKS